MRYLILSDIHSNLHALEAVLNFVRRRNFQSVLVLGDLVGYGAHPDAVVDRVRGLKTLHTILRGNHDRVVVREGEEQAFNLPAIAAVLWTRKNLTARNQAFLETLSRGPVRVDGFTLCHGSPVDEDQYVLSEREAWMSFQSVPTDLIFFGHSHVPCGFALDHGRVDAFLVAGPHFHFTLKRNVRYMINPGSVGQPRDGNPEASFCIYDARRRAVTFFRVPYDVAGAQEAILNAGLPPNLAHRLALGR
jgi:predicted phosphodiesterase